MFKKLNKNWVNNACTSKHSSCKWNLCHLRCVIFGMVLWMAKITEIENIVTIDIIWRTLEKSHSSTIRNVSQKLINKYWFTGDRFGFLIISISIEYWTFWKIMLNQKVTQIDVNLKTEISFENSFNKLTAIISDECVYY